MPLSPRLRARLIRHHLPLALASTAATALLALVVFQGHAAFRWSMATAYVALVLLGLTLCIGPWHLLRARRSPLSSDLRRDCGIWAGLVGLAHVVVGLQVHLGSMLPYFLVRREGGPWLPRVDLFGLTNWAGLASGLVLVMLLALSNDASLRRLGRERWKRLQRWAYAAALLMVAHAVAYQLLERRTPAWVLFFAAVVALVTAAQLWGRRRHRAVA